MPRVLFYGIDSCDIGCADVSCARDTHKERKRKKKQASGQIKAVKSGNKSGGGRVEHAAALRALYCLYNGSGGTLLLECVL